MARCKRLVVVFISVLLAGACNRPPAGVLTLAPGGMRTTGESTPHPDGTLTLLPAASAEAVAFVDAGPVTLTITAQSSTSDAAPTMELWFDGTRAGSVQVHATELTAFPFHVTARASGPTALRVVFVPAGSDGSTTLHVQKVVITEP